jgi:hypothetical protein
MSKRYFEDEFGRKWAVTKLGSSLKVSGEKNEEEDLAHIARSCAYRLGVSETKSGTPIEYINQHRRIWNAIWNKGEIDL